MRPCCFFVRGTIRNYHPNFRESLDRLCVQFLLQRSFCATNTRCQNNFPGALGALCNFQRSMWSCASNENRKRNNTTCVRVVSSCAEPYETTIQTLWKAWMDCVYSSYCSVHFAPPKPVVKITFPERLEHSATSSEA